MKRLMLLLVAVIAISQVACLKAQTVKYGIYGCTVDSVTLEPEPYATFRVYRLPEEKEAAVMFVSDENGKFAAELPAKGEYRIYITSVGRKPYDMKVNVNGNTNLGTVRLSEDVRTLGEVSVVAKKPLVKVDMDKIAYDVEEDPESESKTVMDMMRKVPMISVDGEDNISLAGKSSYKIYVNGKPNNMMTNNPKEILKSMPASSVKNIEVITNPGVKYDAEGVGGIINIVTTENSSIEGYSANVSASYMTNNGYYASLYGTTKIGKFSVSGNYGYARYNQYDSKSNAEFEYLNNPQISSVAMNYDDIDYSSRMHNMSLDASYELDSLNLFSLSGSFFRMNYDNSYFGNNIVTDHSGNIISKSDLNVSGRNTYGSGNMSFDYQHLSAHNPGEMFVFSYRMDRSPVSTNQFTLTSGATGADDYDKHQISDGRSLENTFQADYTLPFRKYHTVNFGAKYIYRINDSKNSELHRADAESDWVDIGQVGSGDNRHHQHVFGIYGEYNLRYKSLGLKGGLRYEYTSQKVMFDNYSVQDYSARFSDLVPSLLLSYSIGTSQNVTLGYNMRISRPGIQLLNPFRDSSQSLYILSYGNPELDTERHHSLTASYGYFSPNFTLSLNLDYSFTNNGITSYSFVDKNGVVNYTSANIGREHFPLLNMYMNWNPSGKTRLTLSCMAGYKWMETNGKPVEYDVTFHKNRGAEYNINMSVQQNLPWKLKLSGYGGGGQAGMSLYTVKAMRYYYYGLQLQRSFLKEDRMSVSLSVNNFAPKYFNYSFEQRTDDYIQRTENLNRQMNYSVTLSYRLGNLRSSVKKAAKTISNTDVIGGGGASAGGNSVPKGK